MLPGVWDSSLEGGTSGRGQRPGFAQPPLPHDWGHCGLACTGALDTLCHAPHSPLHTTSITGSELPGCVLGKEDLPNLGKVGGDGITPLLSQHPRLSPSPEGYQWGRQPFPSLAAFSSLVWARLWPDPTPWGQPGNVEQDMLLTLKFSKQAAALVCSPAKQRNLFPVTCSQLFLYPRDAPGPPKLCWAEASTATASDAHEDISDGSSPGPRPWSSSPTAEPLLPRSAADSHRLGQDACARTGVGVTGGSRGHTVPLQGR